MSNQKEIKFKTKKISLICGIILLFFAFLFEIVLVDNAMEKKTSDDIILLILGNIIFVGFLTLIGVFAVYTYFRITKHLRNSLQKYGKENLIKNINTSSISIYREPMSGAQIYFTDKLIIAPSETIIDYNEISMMYKRIVSTNGGRHVYIAFELYDGSLWSLCDQIEDQMIHNYMQLCFQHNPNIIFGHTKENLAKHKERVKEFKKGNISIPDLTL